MKIFSKSLFYITLYFICLTMSLYFIDNFKSKPEYNEGINTVKILGINLYDLNLTTDIDGTVTINTFNYPIHDYVPAIFATILFCIFVIIILYSTKYINRHVN